MTFEELGLSSAVLKSLKELGFETPTPIQVEAIPHLLKEDSDFVGLAQTGTGKTAAFGLPLVTKVKDGGKIPQGLVICPTRELCLQISKDLQNYAKHSNVSVTAVYGGTDIRRQMADIKNGVGIVVATPGRLVDLTKRKAIRLDEIQWVVLDEADEMLNMGFKEDIDLILDATPVEKNVWLFSATMPKEVALIAKNYMENPLEVSIGHKNQTNENINHVYYSIKERDRYSALKRLIDFNPTIYGLIFCRTRRETGMVAEQLAKEGYNAEPLHGDLSQAQRDSVMKRFRERSIQILVATDVAARGIDVDDITHVINYNLPDDIENYTHRSGRTARAGKKGESLVLINTREMHKIKSIERAIRTSFTKGEIPNAKEICEIQLMKLVDNVISTKVREDDIQEFLPLVMREFESLSKEDIVKQFISAEFNRFIEYYQRAGDLNASSDSRGDRGDRDDRGGRDRDRGDRNDRGDRGDRGERGGRRGNDENKTRFFVNLGNRDGLNPGGLLRVICDSTGLTSDKIGRIDILASFSFFEADNDLATSIVDKVNGQEYEGNKVSVEITKSKDGESSRGGSGGGRPSNRSGGSGGYSGGSGGYSGGGGGRRSDSSGGGERRGSYGGGASRRSDDSGGSDRRSGGYSGGSGGSGGARRGDSSPSERRSDSDRGSFRGGRDGGSREGGSREGGSAPRGGFRSGGGSSDGGSRRPRRDSNS